MNPITTSPEAPFCTVAALIREHAQRQPERPALRDDQRELSYVQLDALMDRIAAALQRDGVLPGDSIAICAHPSVHYAALFLGALRAGVVVAPLAP
jgi:acyl-CoA synthetase (AMP-forming)/AMP-acid ligase II